MLLHALGDCIGQTAAAGENSAVVRRIVKHALGQRGDVDLLAVEQRLQLLKGHRRIHIRLHLFPLHLALFGGARPDEDHLAVLLVRLQIFGDGRHRRKVVRHERQHLREGFFNVGHKRRTAGAGEEALFGKLS